MSDLESIQNTLDLLSALRKRRLWRVEVGPCEFGDHAGEEFPNVEFGHVRMLGTKLVGTQLPKLVADRWQGRGLLLRGSRFEGARLRNCEISASQAQAVQWPRAVLEGCRIVETPMTNSNLARSVISGCQFLNSDLNHCNLTEAFIIGSQFSDQRQGGAILDNANLAGAVLCNVDLRGANLLRANFEGAVLVHVDLRDANLVDVRFDGAVLIDVKLDRADMSESTARAVKAAAGGIDDIARVLSHHHDPAQLALITAAAIVTVKVDAPRAAAATTAGGEIETLLRSDFSTLLRELQGRGGPAELGRLRVEGNHVYARGVDGQEVRLTDAERAEPVRPPQMRTPEPLAAPRPGPDRAAPTRPAVNRPEPSRGGPGRPEPAAAPAWSAASDLPAPTTGEGLEID